MSDKILVSGRELDNKDVLLRRVTLALETAGHLDLAQRAEDETKDLGYFDALSLLREPPYNIKLTYGPNDETESGGQVGILDRKSRGDDE